MFEDEAHDDDGIQEDLPGMGHNEAPLDPEPDAGDHIEALNQTAQSQLRSFMERVERLMEDRTAVMEDMKQVFLEAKGTGFDTKILRKLIALRRQNRAKRQEEEALLDIYISAVGGI